jgi:hypothetical protein
VNWTDHRPGWSGQRLNLQPGRYERCAFASIPFGGRFARKSEFAIREAEMSALALSLFVRNDMFRPIHVDDATVSAQIYV